MLDGRGMVSIQARPEPRGGRGQPLEQEGERLGDRVVAEMPELEGKLRIGAPVVFGVTRFVKRVA